MVRRSLGLDHVVDHFTLVGGELALLRNKSGAILLGFAALLKFLLWQLRGPCTSCPTTPSRSSPARSGVPAGTPRAVASRTYDPALDPTVVQTEPPDAGQPHGTGSRRLGRWQP